MNGAGLPSPDRDLPAPGRRGAEVTVDARGVLCPVPIIRLARAASAHPAGTVLELVTDDPAAAHDVPAWCRLRGHTLLSTQVVAGSVVVPASSAADVLGPEPHAPNTQPGQSLRHLIRLEGPPSAVSAPG